jgi:plastocyanin
VEGRRAGDAPLLRFRRSGSPGNRTTLARATRAKPPDTSLVDESLLVDRATRGIKNVVVAANALPAGPADTGSPIPSNPVMANKGCRFEPHVVLATPTTPLTITNDDPFTHAASIAALGGASLTSEVVQPNGKTEIGKLTARGVYVVSCPLHGWMRGYVVVLKQGPAGITDARGTVALDGLAPGRRTLTLWHETLGSKRLEVDVVAGRTTTLTLSQDDFPAKSPKQASGREPRGNAGETRAATPRGARVDRGTATGNVSSAICARCPP